MAILKDSMLYTLNSNNKYEAFSPVENETFILIDDVYNDIYNLCGSEYNIAVKSPLSQQVIRVYLLNNDETLSRDISEYIIDWDLSFLYKQGMTHTGNITIMNYNEEWNPSPIKQTVWKGTKFKIEIGTYYNKFIFWKDCGIFVCGNISLDYENETIDIPIYDKFAIVDGTVSGKRANSFTIPVGTPIKSAIELCLNLPKDDFGSSTSLTSLPNMSDSNIYERSALPSSGSVGYVYKISDVYYFCNASRTFVELIESQTYQVASKIYRFNGKRFIEVSNETFDFKPIIFPFACINEVTPYTITTDENCTVGDIIIKLADMISCDVSYNTTGNLTLIQGAVTNDDLENKTILWSFDENEYTKPKYDIKFSELVNQIIVAGSIENGKQYKAMLVNTNPKSQMNIYMTSPAPLYIEDSNLVGDNNCNTRAKYEMIKQGRLSIQMKFDSIYIPHLECNYLVTIPDSHAAIKNEKFVVNSINISSDMKMSLSVSSLNEVCF